MVIENPYRVIFVSINQRCEAMGKLYFRDVFRLFNSVKASEYSKEVIDVYSLQDAGYKYSFCLSSLVIARSRIAVLLSQLPDEMKHTTQDAPPLVRWIMARYNWRGVAWTQNLNHVDMLLAIGRAIGQVKMVPPTEQSDPCDMPYAYVAVAEAMAAERMRPKRTQMDRLAYWNYGDVRVCSEGW